MGCLGAAAAVGAGEEGWNLLFDGRSFAGWTLGDGGAVTHSWVIEDGALATVAGTKGRSDLLCTTPLRDFELTFEFRLTKGSNTGVKYFVMHTLRYLSAGNLAGSYGAIGLEFQLADDEAPEISPHPDAKLGSLYGLLPPQEKPDYRLGEWGSARLICRANGCEHWVNGKRVLAYDPGSPEMQRKFTAAAVDPAHSIVGSAAAMVATHRRPGRMPATQIALQQHDSKAWFRELRVRMLA